MAAISQEDRAYRRGVVFGFTVAEVVLLLVFCLLLLFMPLLLGEKSKPLAKIADSSIYLKVPELGALSVAGKSGPAIPAQSPAPSGNASAKPAEAAKRDDPALGDPAAANNSSAQTAPLPEGWIRVAPNAAKTSSTQSTSSDEAQNGQPPSDAPFEALPLASVCEKLGVSGPECAANAINEKLTALGRHNWPPIIKLKEADGEFFVVGSAQVSPAFEAKIRRDVVPKILDLVRRYQTDVVEIVGHTDEQPIPSGIPSTLDALSVDVIAKGEPAARLTAADNAGLGFARALAVVQILNKDERLKRLTILPLSAAQMVDVDGKLSNGSKGGDVKERRRIEVRVRQSND